MIKVSVIIPIYNVASYLPRCLESVLGQTYTNIEVICVDDGSTDRSYEICKAYAQKDERLKVFSKSNEGVAATRNIGLNHVTGEYISFIDPDDWIELDMIEKIMSKMIQHHADIGICRFSKDDDKKIEYMLNDETVASNSFGRDELIRYAFSRYNYKGVCGYLWNKVFKTTLINFGNENIRFDKNLHVGEDILFFTEVAMRSKKNVYIDESLYHYYQRESSLWHSASIEKREGSLIAFERIIKLLELYKVENDTSKWAKRFYTYHASLLAECAYDQRDYKQYKMFCNEIKRYLKEYEETNNGNIAWMERMNLLIQKADKLII